MKIGLIIYLIENKLYIDFIRRSYQQV
jgi:hypothetical protein